MRQPIATLRIGRQAIDRAGRTAEDAHAFSLQLQNGDLFDRELTRDAFNQLVRAARQAQSAVEQAAGAFQEARNVGLLTVETLHVICDAIWPDMNLQYILNYYSEIGDSLVERFRGVRNSETGANGQVLIPPPATDTRGATASEPTRGPVPPSVGSSQANGLAATPRPFKDRSLGVVVDGNRSEA
jgi:hypothetical protein